MRFLIRLFLAVLLLAVVAAGAGLAYLYTQYPDVPPAGTVKVEPTPERLARGDYLSNHVTGCTACHAVRDFSRFAGPVKPGTLGLVGERFDREISGFPGTLHTPNITPAAIGSWSDGEVLRAFRSGVSNDGRPLFPLMPYPRFAQLTEEDAYAIVAYLRTLPPKAEAPVPPSDLDFPLNFLVRTMPSHAAYGVMPPREDKVAYGGYLVNAASCIECHTPMDDRGQPLPGMAFAGGNEFRLPPRFYRVRSANITPDADTGIGSWSEQQFVDKFKAFERPDEHELTDAEQRQNTMMPWPGYAGMTREDLAAIYAYLRSQKPVIHRVDRFPDTLLEGAR